MKDIRISEFVSSLQQELDELHKSNAAEGRDYAINNVEVELLLEDDVEVGWKGTNDINIKCNTEIKY